MSQTQKVSDGGPAYPQHGWSKDPGTIERMQANCGMTLRDYFAGQVVMGMYASPISYGNRDVAAENAYRQADKMLAERAKGFVGRCDKCELLSAEPLHPCPYKADINGDSETLCNCCDNCRDQCAQDI